MIDERDLLERALHRFEPQPGLTDRVYRRRERKHRNQRIGAGALAIILALVSFVALTRAFRTAERPADEAQPKPQGIFSEVGGWIAYGNKKGIWAVNPTRPGHPEEQIQLSERDGKPLAWSTDGSKLLISRWVRQKGQLWSGLFVLNADGTETRIAFGPAFGNATWHSFPGGSFSPNGSKVVYADDTWDQRTESSTINIVDSDGGRPKFLHASQSVSPEFFHPVFSPDGQQIAYIAGWGDHDNGVWIMNADGSDARELADPAEIENPHRILGWSTDSPRIFFDGCCKSGVWVVGADGSGLAPLFD